MRLAIIDTLSTIVFFTVLAGLTELYVAGMDPSEVLKTRIIMVPMMILTGRPMARGVTGFLEQRDRLFLGVSP